MPGTLLSIGFLSDSWVWVLWEGGAGAAAVQQGRSRGRPVALPTRVGTLRRPSRPPFRARHELSSLNVSASETAPHPPRERASIRVHSLSQRKYALDVSAGSWTGPPNSCDSSVGGPLSPVGSCAPGTRGPELGEGRFVTSTSNLGPSTLCARPSWNGCNAVVDGGGARSVAAGVGGPQRGPGRPRHEGRAGPRPGCGDSGPGAARASGRPTLSGRAGWTRRWRRGCGRGRTVRRLRWAGPR
jgi:hypothetical protein